MKPTGQWGSMERVSMYVPTAPKVDRLMERIGGLSNPRDYAAETVPEGLVDSLPPEGIFLSSFLLFLFFLVVCYYLIYIMI